jgi:hypothetical protein
MTEAQAAELLYILKVQAIMFLLFFYLRLIFKK